MLPKGDSGSGLIIEDNIVIGVAIAAVETCGTKFDGYTSVFYYSE